MLLARWRRQQSAGAALCSDARADALNVHGRQLGLLSGWRHSRRRWLEWRRRERRRHSLSAAATRAGCRPAAFEPSRLIPGCLQAFSFLFEGVKVGLCAPAVGEAAGVCTACGAVRCSTCGAFGGALCHTHSHCVGPLVSSVHRKAPAHQSICAAADHLLGKMRAPAR